MTLTEEKMIKIAKKSLGLTTTEDFNGADYTATMNLL